MATRTITTKLALDGEDAFKAQMSSVNREMRGLREEMKLSETQFKGQANSMEALTDKQKILRKQIEQQEEMIRALNEAYEDSAKAGDGMDKRTDDFRQSLTRAQRELIEMNRELQDTEKYLDEAKKSADGTARSIDEFGKEAKDAKKSLGDLSLDDLIGSLGDLKKLAMGGAIGVVVTGLKEAGSAVLELEESTREWRAIMGGLEVSSQAAGYSAEQTAEAYNYLYGVLGDTQTTATTLANLQAIGLEQSDLMAIIDATTGAWNKYGDSIPIDGLAESINETIRAGQITGTFADVINWGSDELQTFGVALKEDTEANKEWNEAVQDATTSEDYFNLALQQCQTEAERANLVMQAMADQGLAEAGQAYREVNEDIVKANESQARMEAAMGQLGEACAPLANALRNLGAGGLEFIAGMIDSTIDKVRSLIGKFREMKTESKDANKSLYVGKQGDDNSIRGSFATGLNRVPYDGFVAELHRDEAILTAQEAALWRSLTAAGSQPQNANPIRAGAESAAERRTGGAAQSRNISITVNSVLDGKVLAKTVTEYQDREARGNG